MTEWGKLLRTQVRGLSEKASEPTTHSSVLSPLSLLLLLLLAVPPIRTIDASGLMEVDDD